MRRTPNPQIYHQGEYNHCRIGIWLTKPDSYLAVVRGVLVLLVRVAARLVQVRKVREQRGVKAPVAREQQRAGRRGERHVRGRVLDLDEVASVCGRPALSVSKREGYWAVSRGRS